MIGRYLATETGIIDLDSSARVVSRINIDNEQFQEPNYVGLGLHSDGEWIVLLPRVRSGNRNKPLAVSASTLALEFTRSEAWVFYLYTRNM